MHFRAVLLFRRGPSEPVACPRREHGRWRNDFACSDSVQTGFGSPVVTSRSAPTFVAIYVALSRSREKQSTLPGRSDPRHCVKPGVPGISPLPLTVFGRPRHREPSGRRSRRPSARHVADNGRGINRRVRPLAHTVFLSSPSACSGRSRMPRIHQGEVTSQPATAGIRRRAFGTAFRRRHPVCHFTVPFRASGRGPNPGPHG